MLRGSYNSPSGIWLLRECTASPLGVVTKSAWRVDGMRGFPHGIFVEFRKKEKKVKGVPHWGGEKENDGLGVAGGEGWFRRRRQSSIMTTARSEKSLTKADSSE